MNNISLKKKVACNFDLANNYVFDTKKELDNLIKNTCGEINRLLVRAKESTEKHNDLSEFWNGVSLRMFTSLVKSLVEIANHEGRTLNTNEIRLHINLDKIISLVKEKDGCYVLPLIKYLRDLPGSCINNSNVILHKTSYEQHYYLSAYLISLFERE